MGIVSVEDIVDVIVIRAHDSSPIIRPRAVPIVFPPRLVHVVELRTLTLQERVRIRKPVRETRRPAASAGLVVDEKGLLWQEAVGRGRRGRRDRHSDPLSLTL